MTEGATSLTSGELASLARSAIGERGDARLRASLEGRRREDAAPASVARYLERVLGAEQPSPEEEARLAQLAKDGHEWAREVLIAALLPRLVASARRYAGDAGELTDLIQEGVLASLEALLRFEPRRGVPFWAYAAPWVRGAMSRSAWNR